MTQVYQGRLLAMGERHGQRELARQFIQQQRSEAELADAILKKYQQQKPTDEIGLTNAEARRFSFLKCIRAQLDPGRFEKTSGFERACSDAVSDQTGQVPRGFFVPLEACHAKRDLSVGVAGAGGNLVQTELLDASFIDILRNESVLNQVGITEIPGLVGDVAIPKKLTGANVVWISTEGSPSSESEPTFGQVTMSPKTAGAFTDYTRQLLLQSSPGIEGLVRSDLAEAMATELDRVGLHGSGASGEPTGVSNTGSIGTVTFASLGDPTFAEIISLESTLGAANARRGNLAYTFDETLRGTLKGKPKVSGQDSFILEDEAMNGYRALSSNQVEANSVFFANWAELLMGMWGGLDILVDPYTSSTTGTVRIRVFQSVDFAVRHSESFVLGSGGT